MFYQTRQLVSTADQSFGNQFLKKGQPFSASGVDAEYLLKHKKAVLPAADNAESEPPLPETTNFHDFVNDPRIPGLEATELAMLVPSPPSPPPADAAELPGMPSALVQTSDAGTSVPDTAENSSQPAKSEPEAAADSSTPANTAEATPAADTVAAVPRRTITRRSVNQ